MPDVFLCVEAGQDTSLAGAAELTDKKSSSRLLNRKQLPIGQQSPPMTTESVALGHKFSGVKTRSAGLLMQSPIKKSSDGQQKKKSTGLRPGSPPVKMTPMKRKSARHEVQPLLETRSGSVGLQLLPVQTKSSGLQFHVQKSPPIQKTTAGSEQSTVKTRSANFGQPVQPRGPVKASSAGPSTVKTRSADPVKTRGASSASLKQQSTVKTRSAGLRQPSQVTTRSANLQRHGQKSSSIKKSAVPTQKQSSPISTESSSPIQTSEEELGKSKSTM